MFPSEQELQERYSTWSTFNLLSVLHNKGQYTPLAVEVARAELGQRNVTTDEVDAFLQRLEELEIARCAMSAFHLTFWEKAVSFFMWFAPWIHERAFKISRNDGRLLFKIKQSRFFSFGGFVSALVDASLTTYFHLSSGMCIFLLLFSFVIFCWRETKVSYDLTPT
jgi:hypothetical protein